MMMSFRRIGLKFGLPPRSRFFAGGSNSDISNAIAELNQEMESVFGEPPYSSLAGSSHNQTIAQEIKNDTTQDETFSSSLSHIDSKGEAQMVDISSKGTTKRVAVATCRVLLGQKVFGLVSANEMAKGDVLGVAKIAGICGAKRTSNLIPLCHNISLSSVRVDLKLNARDHSVEIESEAASTGKTGVEMEALVAASVAGLTVYDMCKAASKDIVITDLRLEHKEGGKSGEWTRQK